MEDEEEYNGQRLGGILIPPELLETLMGSIPISNILKISEVCTKWLKIIRKPVFWKQYYPDNNIISWNIIHDHVQERPDEWAVHFAACKFNVFRRNLLVNPFGIDGFDGWNILSGDKEVRRDDGVDLGEEMPGWTVFDNPGLKINNYPEGLGPAKCFTTDAFSCSKEQRIDLWEAGFTPTVMRACVPFKICWNAYVGVPNGHEGFHEMYIRLLNKNGKQIHPVPSGMTESRNISVGSPFTKYGGIHVIQKTDHEIINKLRFIYFYHGGMSRRDDEGPIGPYIYNPSVSIELE